MTAPDVTIQVVTQDEAGELLTLRRAAFVSEAQIYGDPNIPPLTQTLPELREDLAADGVITLGARAGHRLVGSIRVVIEEKKATLGRLAVAPDLQGKGIGTQLLLAILPHLPEDTEEVWVFTGQDSVQNLAMYAKQGYEHQYDRTAGDLTYAYLRRILGDGDGADDADDADDADEDDDAPSGTDAVTSGEGRA
ncbi:GNAT family N-acetyltransferase [Pengzhenrongella frigida]|uniref:GNAT family N-acetyltransferase n=1 Tax=Pengzhenrongella frigida TaxID=1259133 RepID=A0A4Q5N281_9MICO|nr:GNAT family N-acetyltransferase [Cellulomonas sp. HLT2-17]RYV52249.1 GNAT family N-acetyltransferase [Cellulomonas sp. HLT2-17]